MDDELKSAEKAVEPAEEETIKSCGCSDETDEPHTCPYDDELGLNGGLCRCCSSCAHHCYLET